MTADEFIIYDRLVNWIPDLRETVRWILQQDFFLLFYPEWRRRKISSDMCEEVVNSLFFLFRVRCSQCRLLCCARAKSAPIVLRCSMFTMKMENKFLINSWLFPTLRKRSLSNEKLKLRLWWQTRSFTSSIFIGSYSCAIWRCNGAIINL